MKTQRFIKNRNGEIAIYITKASGTSKGCLLCIHGGPGGDYRGNNDIFEDISNFAPQKGYHVIQFDMFGAGKSDGTPAEITLKTQLEDYLSVLRFARSFFSNSGSLHVVGESMGATIAALEWKRNIHSYILLWPAFDLKDTDLKPYLLNKWKSELDKKGYLEDGDIILGREFLSEIATFDFSDCFVLPRKPCLLVHGKKDTAVPFKQSLEAITKAQGESVLYAHPSGDHGLQKKDERDFARNAIKGWLSIK